MKTTVFKLFNSKGAALAVCGILSIFGVMGSASADCETGAGDPSSYTLLIDASSSCANLSGNMFGCEVDGSGQCTIDKLDSAGNVLESITVQLDNGSVGGTTPIDWSVLYGDSLVDLAIVVGANNGGSCGTTYTPGSSFGKGLIFKKNNGDNQKVNKLFFCSDFTQPLPDKPRLIVTKTVTTSEGTCSSPDTSSDSLDIDIDINGNDPATGEPATVRYCYKVENVGAGLAEAVTLIDDAGTPGASDPVPTDDFPVTLNGLNDDGSLGTGGTATGSELVAIAVAGTVINTVEATATGFGGDVSATDTATVNAVQVAEACPENYQEAVNQLSETTGLDFAFLQDPNEGERRSVCVPNGASASIANTKRYACIDECITKPECVGPAPLPASCSPSVCEPSGSWTTKRIKGIDGFPDTFACEAFPDTTPPYTPADDPPAYCWEIQQDLKGDCSGTEWNPQEESVLHIKKGRVNPYVWQTCYSSGGRYVCETMCYLFPGDSPSACPLGSTVF